MTDIEDTDLAKFQGISYEVILYFDEPCPGVVFYSCDIMGCSFAVAEWCKWLSDR